jgi:hypothetical protein
MAERAMSRMGLSAMVVGYMVGASIFSLPRTFATVTGPRSAVIARFIAPKVIPIKVFIVIMIFAVKMALFSFDFYSGDLTNGLFEQVNATLLVTLLPCATLQRADIAGMRQPSMAVMLESVVGPRGATFVSVGPLVSLLGARLAWELICAEVRLPRPSRRTYPRPSPTSTRTTCRR